MYINSNFIPSNTLLILRIAIVISLLFSCYSTPIDSEVNLYPCYEYQGICFPIENRSSTDETKFDYSHLPATKKPLRVILYRLDTGFSFGDWEISLKNVNLHFDPVVQMIPQQDYEVVDLEMTIADFKLLSGSGSGREGFMKRNFPYLKRLHLSWEGERSSLTQDFLSGLTFLEEFALKGLPRLSFPKTGNFLSPFANDAASPLKSVILDCKTCNFSSLRLGTVTSLERFELIDAKRPSSINPSSKGLLFPPNIHTVKLVYVKSLQWLCEEFQKVKSGATIRSNSALSSNSSLNLEMYLNYESLSKYQCGGMMDAFFTLPPPVLTDANGDAMSPRGFSAGLNLRGAVVDSILMAELLNREWGALHISGGWAIPKFWFPETASDIVAHVDYVNLPGKLKPKVFISFNCVYTCRSLSFSSTKPEAALLGIYNFKPKKGCSSVVSFSNSFLFVNTKDAPLFLTTSFPHLTSYGASNVPCKMLFERSDPPLLLVGEPSNIRNTSVTCKTDSDNSKSQVIRNTAFANYNAIRFLSLTAEASAIEHNTFEDLPLDSLTIRTSGLNMRAQPTIFPLLGPRATKTSCIHLEGLLIPNLTLPVYHESVKDSFFTRSATFRNGHMKQFDVSSLGSPPCNTSYGFCNGLESLDVSLSNLTELVVNWAKSFEINSLAVSKVRQQLIGKDMCDSCTHIRISDDIIPPLAHSPRNLSAFYRTFGNWETEYERPISTRREITINIRNNGLEELAEESFSNLRSLYVLYASGNNIRSLTPGFLHGKSCMASGCIVDLSNNTLGDGIMGLGRNLSLQAEMGTPVTALGLGGNSIDTFPFGVGKFLGNGKAIWNQGSQNIFHLDLSHNNITNIDESVCLGMSSNTTGTYVVDLSHNNVIEVASDAFECPINVDLHVYLNDNPRLRVIPGEVKFLQSLVSLNLINTPINSENIPCAYQKGEDGNGNKMTLWSLGLGETATPGPHQLGSASVKGIDCCFFVQLKRRYSVFDMNNFPPSMWNSDPSIWNDILFNSAYVAKQIFANGLNPASDEYYQDFQCSTDEFAVDDSTTQSLSFNLFLSEYYNDDAICSDCGAGSKSADQKPSLKFFVFIYTCAMGLYIAFNLTGLKSNCKRNSPPPHSEGASKNIDWCFLWDQYFEKQIWACQEIDNIEKAESRKDGEEGYCEILKVPRVLEVNGELYYSRPLDDLYCSSAIPYSAKSIPFAAPIPENENCATKDTNYI
eukprot:Nk52_evm21s503 gene=Nk52_evmTU21s503